eukprot:TRINITY_DN8_c0_g1_i1.p1 TRINITY_DN8_c0_g1~~TRINITY_DN8_c0_g1_i1.p1  ORF type:complete len:222 (+),score=70.81 TRINITY_DN8_c0_g1_i1:37-702(+)
MVRTKVFVGNLAFKTTQPELAAAFEACGNVVSANIITRGKRSLGYGFVEFEEEHEAERAVQEMDKTVLDEREINVELAKPRVEKSEESVEYDDSPVETRNKNNGRRGRNSRKQSDEPQRQPKEKVESETTLFIANLPYTFDDLKLATLFEDFDILTAHVVTTKSGKSRGYGFVEFSNKDNQQEALAAMDEQEVESGSKSEPRVLSVKVALTEKDDEEETSE